MRALALGLTLAAGIGAHAGAEEAVPPSVRDGLRTAFDIAADPTAWQGKSVIITCQLMLADLSTANCPVYNASGTSVGSILVLVREAVVADRKRAAEECTALANVERCTAMVSGTVDGSYGIVRLQKPRITWLR